MKYLYVISIQDSNGRAVSWGIVATSMAQAVAKAQAEAGVTSDPISFQNMHQIDFDATV